MFSCRVKQTVKTGRIAYDKIKLVNMDCDISESTFVVSKCSNFTFPKQIDLKDCTRSVCVSEFSGEWERNILSLISYRDRRKHSSFIRSVLNEVKNLYIENMKDYILKSTLSCKVYKREPVPCEECDILSNLKRNIPEDSIAYNHSIFLKRRRSFATKYFLSSSIIRHVMNTAHRILPTVICDFRRYRDLGTLTLHSFREMILRDIRRGTVMITNQFYTETYRAVEKSRALKSVSRKRLPQLMKCLTNVFVQQILSVMMRSIDHIIHVMRDDRYCPQIEFQLVCENDELVTKPDMEEVFSTYHDIIRKIEGIAQDLMPLEEWLDFRVKERYIKISLPEWFVESSHCSLQEILDTLFRPVNEHVQFVSAEFSRVYTSSARKRISSLVFRQPDFDAYLMYIHKYNEYLGKTNRMLSNLYYKVGTLQQNNAKESLRQICRDVVNILTMKLVDHHQEFNRSICSDFEELKSTALDVRKDAESLIQLAEYMSHASKVLMKELEQKIRRSIYMLSKLLEITILTDKHIELNRTTINWLHDIQPVFSQNNTLCEAMKSELEEDLQRRISTLNSEVDAMFPQLVILDDMDDISRVGEYAEHYKNLIKKYKRLDDEMEIINSEEKLFKFPETEFLKIIELKETIVPFYTLIRTIYQWRRDHSVWLNGPFECLDASVIEKKITYYYDEITEMSKTMKARIKIDATANKAYKFSGVADDPDPMQQPAPLRLCWQALNNVNEFKVYLPLAVCMCNPALNARHWKEMSAICNFDLTPNAGTTLKKMIDMNLMDNIDKYKAISLGANKELHLQRELAEMIKKWEPISFEMSKDEESGTVVFKHVDDIETLLREHLIRIEEMRTSHFVKPILENVIDFSDVLSRIQETFDRWMCIQLRKLHLEPIFSYPQIETRLSQETSLYLSATKILSKIVNRFAENPTFEGIKKSSDLEVLHEVNEKLENAARGVKNYLDMKKLSFARFFFLEDSEIQQILFESIDVAKRHTLVKKCFAGVERLKLSKSNCIRGVIGLHGEILHLSGNISISVDSEHEEQWLIQLEKELRNAVRENISRYHLSIDRHLTLDESVDDFPSMTIVCGLHLYWTSSVEKCLATRNTVTLNSLSSTYTNVINSTVKELKNKLTRRRRSLLMSLIIIMLTHKEVIQLLLERNAEQTDFEWIAQLKYYYKGKNVEVSTFDVTIEYGYEYTYYRQNIVNTPLTDRCFCTLLQAYRYHLYGGVVGPTSTGKTETIKGLTRALAKLYHVVSCNNSISYSCMMQIFKGMISCGAWICLENFNSLRVELLSAIAQTLTQMKQAVSSNLRTVSLEDHNLNLNVSGNICVTINSERPNCVDLPDNLKVFFRSVSMTTPDVDKIAEVELFAGGFLRARDLATTLTVSYKLLSEYLGSNDRYNFSASSLKTVIATAIGMKQTFPGKDEHTLLLRSMIDINVPQLRNIDVPVFQSIVRNVFPESVRLPFDCAEIWNALENVCAKRCLTLHSTFKLKVIQIIELIYVRRGLVLIGDPLVGKTEILRTLAETLSFLRDEGAKIGATVKLETIMPGMVDNDALFGCFCDKIGGWKDGLCTAIFRRFAEDTSTDRRWLVFDGTLSDMWIENLYTTLDENKMLHLTSGERILVKESTSVIFETTGMAEISPGVISRCGIIYIDSLPISWRPYVQSHVAKHDIYDGYEKVLYAMFDWTMDPCLNFLKENSDILASQESHLVMSTLNLFEMLMRDAYEDAAEDKEKNSHFVIWAQAALILALAWGLGGNLIDDSQTRFNAFCVSLWNGADTAHPKPDAIKQFDVTLPSEGLIQDNFYVFKGIGNWRYWGDLLKLEKIPEMCDFNSIYVPSISSMKYNYVFLRHVKYRKPFLLCGDVAVGKTCLMRDLLNNKLSENCLSNCFSFTSMVTVARTQRLLLSKLSKIRHTEYGPGRNQFCVNFVDDINTGTLQRPESQRVLELLRQLFNYNYCYDTNDLSKIFLQDVMFTLAITGKINGNVSPRFLSHFNTYAIPALTTDNIFRTYFNVLLANMKRNLFAADVTGSVTSIVNATIDVYKLVAKTLRPVPSKLYYCFDMRDISRVINGCGLIQKESVETKITFIRLWAHEILRVFRDRMLDESDKEWLFLRIRDAVKNNFKDSFEVAFDHLPKSENNQITKDSFNDLIFGNFIDTEKGGKCSKRYEEIGSMDALKNKVLACLDEYNATSKRKLDMVVCRYVLESLIKISRILSIPGESVLLISSVGSGGKSVTTLAAFMQQQSLFEITTESYYDIDVWRDNLKRVLRECGALRKDVTYFVTERQMKDAFLSDISCLLSTGELPDLFSTEEKQSIIEITRLHAQDGDRNAELSSRLVMKYFVEQCKNRLHFVLCFSPTSIAFRTYLCSHPNLAKHCTVNYNQVWPDETFLEIAVKHMKNVNVQDEVKIHATRLCVQFHNSAKEMSLKYHKMFGRSIHVTSSAFLHMLKLYTRLTSKKQEEIVATRNRYLAGLEKLEMAAEQVEQMKATLTRLKPQLELSAEQTVITMKKVENENVTVERATILVKEEEEVANKKAEIAGALKTECEADLAVAIPILEDAVMALNTLKPTDITLVKAMKNPPDTIKLVMAAVCVMLGVLPDRGIDPVTGKKFTDYWGPSKRVLGDMNFLQNLKDYDKDNIPPAVMQIIKKTYMTDNSFMPHIVAKASSAAEGLCKWVRAMVSYDEVAKVVAPKKKKLAAAQRECDEAEAFLNEKRQTLAALNAKLAALNDSLRQTLQKKLNLENEVATCTAKLVKAEKLIASLGGEKSHWMQCARNLQMNYDSLVGDMLLSCGIIAYMASYSTSFRDEMLARWKELVEASEIPYTKMYNFVNVLGVEIEINHWQLCGLSKNRFAVENAIILNNSWQWCLFIDSQNQINQWIKKIEQKNDLKVIKLTDSDYISVIARNIEDGVPVLLENIGERLEIALEPILLKNIYQDEDWYIDIGTKSIKYSQDFRLYITTRLSNPNYTADVFSKLTIIDFSMPDGTLRDKLLDIVISKERPEIQEKFEALRIQDAANKKILQQQEDNILSILSSTTTNILEDESAIQTLDSSKTLTVDIMKRQKEAKAMTEDINKFRDTYLQFAEHCAGLFCTLSTLSNLNHMYRFSFSWFIQLYITSIETSNRSVVLEKRLHFLKSSFTRNLHSSVCRSLFEKHKLLYSFLLCAKILIDSGQTTQEEVEYFISPESLEDRDTIHESTPEWLSIDKWTQICKLSRTFPYLRKLADDFPNNVAWKDYCNATPFQSDLMPKQWRDNLTRFQKLMLVKIIRCDKIVVEVMRLIEDTMEDVFNTYPQLQIFESYAESSCLTPIIFILPCYVSPLSLVSAYASARGYTSKFISLSMGDEQSSNAEILVEQARREGGWILLQNCHQVVPWIPRLEKICESFNLTGTSLDFRLWLSSLSAPDFPISILQNSVKIAYDYPLQLKQSLLKMYRSDPINKKDFFEGCPGKDKEFSKLLYGLCFFHCIVRERRHFGQQGWNIPYDFDHVDFEISVNQLQNLINEAENVPFDTLLYLVGKCNYGGKVANSFDQRCLRCLLDCFCNINVIDNSRYSFSDCAQHSIPQRCEYRDIIIHIDNMQLDASPEAFATDENALVAKDTAIAREFLNSISRLDQVRSSDHEIVPDRVLHAISEIDDKLPAVFNIDEIQEKHRLGSREPLNAILLHEAELINRILTVIKSSLADLRSALNGEIILTDSLEDLSNEIYNHKVPRIWRMTDVSIVTECTSNYVGLLLKRVNFIETWRRENDVPRVIYFDALSCCRRFLCATLLMFSRRHNIPVKQIALDFKVRNNSTPSTEDADAYYIHGLHLSGARWDTQRCLLIESSTNIFWRDMPPICLTFSNEASSVDNVYECPVYTSPTQYEANVDTSKNNKRNYIVSIPLETDKPHVYWVKRGTALFCQVGN